MGNKNFRYLKESNKWLTVSQMYWKKKLGAKKCYHKELGHKYI